MVIRRLQRWIRISSGRAKLVEWGTLLLLCFAEGHRQARNQGGRSSP